jgi:hypothetical protein
MEVPQEEDVPEVQTMLMQLKASTNNLTAVCEPSLAFCCLSLPWYAPATGLHNQTTSS